MHICVILIILRYCAAQVLTQFLFCIKHKCFMTRSPFVSSAQLRVSQLGFFAPTESCLESNAYRIQIQTRITCDVIKQRDMRGTSCHLFRRMPQPLGDVGHYQKRLEVNRICGRSANKALWEIMLKWAPSHSGGKNGGSATLWMHANTKFN